MKLKAIFGLFAFAVVAFGFGVLSAQPAQADNHKVTICHATDSQTNPYTTNPVSKSSIDEPNNKYLNGHGDHTGPVWYEGIADHSWGDIIPPFIYDKPNSDPISYPGQNWTTEGQAFYNNNCNDPDDSSTDYCDTTQVVGSVANWLKKNGINGADCFDYVVEQRCGYLNVAITDQPYPQYPQGPFRAVYTTNGQVASPYTNFPAMFSEDSNGGSVDVTWFTVGPEKDWLKGTTFPNFWSNVGQTIAVDTDCEEEPTAANITATAKCVTIREQMMIEVALTNSGETDGEATVNGEVVKVAAGATVLRHYAPNTQVTVVVDEQTILDKTLECKPGQGGETPETPTTPESPVVSTPMELPNTSGSMTQVVIVGAASIAALVLAVGSAVKSRFVL